MAAMGADSVDYHGRSLGGFGVELPDHALGYYAERGETPLGWGGAGAGGLGLEGAVTEAQFRAVYGPGGACDPTTGERLVRTARPGFDLVVAAHKSVAELGVIGRAADMHRIMDAERDATMAHLDQLVQDQGGRRGRTATATATRGLVYAHTRHATSRAGDPGPHDHVLVANVVEMLDAKGGMKAADTALWRDHLHAATVVGRMASARVAVDLSYAIRADDGPSGRLGHWAIAGVPQAVMDIHSKRAAEIQAAVAERGDTSYRARGVAARDTRETKRHTPVAELLPRWWAETAEAGSSVAGMNRAIERAAAERGVQPSYLQAHETHTLVAEALGPEGRLAERKVYTRRDVLVALAPHLYGLEPTELPRVADVVTADARAVPLIGVAGARERVYAPVSILAADAAIESMVAEGAERRDVPAVASPVVEQAIWRAERALGRPLTLGQSDAVIGICVDGHGVDLVVGVAGAGKTTVMGVVADAYAAAGYDVVGTATSGQAARNLGTEARITESRTLASLLWRLDQGRPALSSRSLVVLDEAGMTNDRGMLRLLAAAASTGAKVVMVGDDRQLGSVGPGGALGALVARHEAHVHVLADNVRQRDPEERAALEELRSGDVTSAVSFYTGHGRLRVRPDRTGALEATVEGWAADTEAGLDTAMLAWRRANVAELNRRGRQAWDEAGMLSGPELVAAGGQRFAAGDRVVTLAPSADGQLVTSERGTVTAVDPEAGALVARMHDGRLQAFGPEEVTGDRLAHGYALTVHRSQGMTVDATHSFEDGGGRELAYVRMSRARGASYAYCVADDVDQAIEDLQREWSSERRQRWAIDSGTPAEHPRAVEAEPGVPTKLIEALRSARLEAERDAVAAAIPPDVRPQLRNVERRLDELRRDRRDLETGHGRYAGTPVGSAARALGNARFERSQAERFASDKGSSWNTRRYWRKQARAWAGRETVGRERWEAVRTPEAERLNGEIDLVNERLDDLRRAVTERGEWTAEHPEAERRLQRLDRELAPERTAAVLRTADLPGLGAPPARCSSPERSLGPELGL